MLAGAARARAALDGRDFVIPDDVKALAPALLRHRLILSPGGRDQRPAGRGRGDRHHRGDRGAALIYPTRAAVLAAAAGAPFALVVAAAAPGRWYARPRPGRWRCCCCAWSTRCAALGHGDGQGRAARARACVGETRRCARDRRDRRPRRRRGRPRWRSRQPRFIGIEDRRPALGAAGGRPRRGAAADDHAAPRPGPVRAAVAALDAARSGWSGSRAAIEIDAAIADPARHAAGARSAARSSSSATRYMGLIAQLDRGDGSDFDALRRISAGHGPARDRLEAVGAAREAARQGIITASATTRSSSRSTAAGRCRSRWPACRGSTARSRRCC